jgi:hypothetical protein
MATLFLRRLGFGPERKMRNTLRNAVINWPDGDEKKSHFRDGSKAPF